MLLNAFNNEIIEKASKTKPIHIFCLIDFWIWILIVLIYIMISLIFWRLKYPEQFTEQISVIIIAIFIILVFSIYYIGCVFIQNFIYFKKYYFFFKQRKALPQKDIGDKKNYNNYKKQSN